MSLSRLIWLLVILPLPALAHMPHTSFNGMSVGLHAFLGVDHLMVLVGASAWLAQTSGFKNVVGFLFVILGGIIAGLVLGSFIPGVSMHSATLLTLLVLATLAALTTSWSTKTKLILLGSVGLIHGFSHGTVGATSLLSNANAGLILSSAIVLCGATGVFIALRQKAGGQWLRLLGFGAAMFGLGCGV